MVFKPQIVEGDGEKRDPVNVQKNIDPDPHGFVLISQAIQKGPSEFLVNLFRGGDIGGKLNDLKSIRDRLVGEGIDIENQHQSIRENEGWRFLDDKSINDMISICDMSDVDNSHHLVSLYFEYKKRERERIRASD